MALTRLSKDDQQLVVELCKKGVLFEEKLEADLSRVLIVTDAENPNPKISLDVETRPLITIANIGGALLLVSNGSEDVEDANLRRVLGKHIIRMLPNFDTLALVATAPSLYMHEIDVNFVRVIDLLVQAHNIWHTGPAHHRTVKSFLIVYVPDGREYTYQVDAVKFRAWYNEYEQRVLGRQTGSFEGEFDLVENGLIR